MQIGMRCDARHGPHRVRAQNTKIWEPILLSSPGNSSRLWERMDPTDSGDAEGLGDQRCCCLDVLLLPPLPGPRLRPCSVLQRLTCAVHQALALWLLTGLSRGEPPARDWREERRESEWSVHGRCPCSFIADFSLLFSPPMSH